MDNKKKILIFTATYNEKPNIEGLIFNIFKNYPFVHMLIIDDNSPDKTADLVINLQNKYNNLHLIKRDRKLGLDTAHKIAYDYALENSYDYFISMDADLSHDPKEISNFLKNLEDYPFVIGSRYMSGGRCLMHGKRLYTSKYGNMLIKFLLGINCNEYTTSYRGFNLNKLKPFKLSKVKSKGYSFFMGTIIEIYKRKIKIKEIPIIFKDRVYGLSKIPKIEIFRTLKNLLIYFILRIFRN